MRFRPPLAILLLCTACASRHPAPVVAPEPTVAAAAPVPVMPGPPAAADTARRVDTTATPVVSDSEVVQRAAAIFEAAPVAAAPAAAAGPMAPDARATWDIDVRSYETHQMVAQYVGIFTGRGRPYMERSMSRGTRYDAMLRRKFREAGLPEDMTYLALIESSYLPHAYSRAAAVGMWQFMAPTARGIGMRVDWWVDERRDPMRATEGAIDFLTDLHDAYGSWYLAAAAYNGGPGRVSRGLRRFSDELDGSEGEDRFFALAEQKYLPSETKAYVPKLIAAAMVAKEPARYGLRVDTMPAFAYDSVMVAGGVSLAAVAKASGSSIDEIRDLNPHFLRGVTPPGEATEVRVPVGRSAGFATAFAALPESERAGWREVRVASLQSAQSIADEAGVPVRALRWVNPKLALDRRGRVRAGTLLRVPTPLTVAGARDVPDPSIARFGSSRASPAVSLVSQRVRVRRGESLTSVARRSGVSVATLRAMNGIRGNRLRAGQVLVVRRPSKKAVAAARRAAVTRSARAGSSERRCTNRVVKVRGKRRTVRSCTAAPSPASPARSARAATGGAKARRGAAAATRPARKARSAQPSRSQRSARKAAPRSTRRPAATPKKGRARQR
ncbi:MAG: transglycosylase SLT domain-containing protein [Gemmatimonadaceae bacterium]|nr:transglycosylase SLT domain-containing protein [Gemmatimonadaceae bacterium]